MFLAIFQAEGIVKGVSDILETLSGFESPQGLFIFGMICVTVWAIAPIVAIVLLMNRQWKEIAAMEERAEKQLERRDNQLIGGLNRMAAAIEKSGEGQAEVHRENIKFMQSVTGRLEQVEHGLEGVITTLSKMQENVSIIKDRTHSRGGS